MIFPGLRAAISVSCVAVLMLVGGSSCRAQDGTAKPAKMLTVEDIFAHGSLAGGAPQGLTWSPNGEHLTYLDGGELLDLDPVTAKTHILVSRDKLASLSGNSANEKDRDHRARYGMASYLWAPDSSHLLFDSNGSLWLYDLKNGIGLNIGVSSAASGDDPKFSPNGKFISFINERGDDHSLSIIHLRDAGTPVTSPITTNNGAVLNGKVDWVYEEELEVRSNYFWSPDSNKIAFLQMDEGNVPEYPITDWIPLHPTVDKQRYPQPGDSNPAVRVGVVSPTGGKPAWIKLPGDAFKSGDDYIPRFGWVDAKTLWIETLARDQKHRDIYFADVQSGQVKRVLELKDDMFLDDNYEVFVGDQKIILTSWEDGHSHLYLYSYDDKNPMGSEARLTRQLTKGDFDVSEVLGIDSKSRVVYYSSDERNATEQQIWQVNMDGKRKAITMAPGVHAGNFAPVGGAFVDRYSTRTTPATVSLCRATDESSKCRLFWSTRAMEQYGLREPERFEVKAADGQTIYATLLLPEGKTEPGSVPLILNPYGGPGVKTAENSWSGDSFLFDTLLAQHGFAVLHADNRGMAGRGRDFAHAAYHNFGAVQLQDQLAVADAALAKYPQLDAKRQGWWGWSWGGTFTLYAMTHSDRFRAGVAVAPVTDWHNYDSIYTERYMSEPADFVAGYKEFSVVNSAAKLHGHLLLAQGTGDDNVHMQNMVQFVQQLTVNNLPYDLQIYPRKTHSIAGTEVRPHLFNRILAEFEMYLKPAVAEGTGK